MKKATTFMAAFVMVMGAAFATEGEKIENENKISIVQWNKDTHQLFYLGKDEGKVIVRVKDADGNTLLRRSIKNEKGFALPLNFEKQVAGDYTLQVQDGAASYEAEFEVTKE